MSTVFRVRALPSRGSSCMGFLLPPGKWPRLHAVTGAGSSTHAWASPAAFQSARKGHIGLLSAWPTVTAWAWLASVALSNSVDMMVCSIHCQSSSSLPSLSMNLPVRKMSTKSRHWTSPGFRNLLPSRMSQTSGRILAYTYTDALMQSLVLLFQCYGVALHLL